MAVSADIYAELQAESTRDVAGLGGSPPSKGRSPEFRTRSAVAQRMILLQRDFRLGRGRVRMRGCDGIGTP